MIPQALKSYLVENCDAALNSKRTRTIERIILAHYSKSDTVIKTTVLNDIRYDALMSKIKDLNKKFHKLPISQISNELKKLEE